MPTIDGVRALESALYALRRANSALESLTAAKDREIGRITVEYGPKLDKETAEIAELEAAIEEYFRANQRRLTGRSSKSVQLQHGTLGLRAPSTPGLVPLNARWTWDKIAKRMKRLYKLKYFHPPKFTLDKRKMRAEMTPEQLAEAGMRLDDADVFYYELASSFAPSNEGKKEEAA